MDKLDKNLSIKKCEHKIHLHRYTLKYIQKNMMMRKIHIIKRGDLHPSAA